MTHSPYYIRCSTRSRNTYNNVFIANITFKKFMPSFLKIIFSIFYRITQSMLSTCDKTNYQSIWHTKSRRNFRCIKHTKTSTCTCSHVENTTTFLHTWHNFRHQFLNSRQSLFNCKRHLLILLIHIIQQLANRHLVQVIVKRTFLSYLFKSHNISHLLFTNY